MISQSFASKVSAARVLSIFAPYATTLSNRVACAGLALALLGLSLPVSANQDQPLPPQPVGEKSVSTDTTVPVDSEQAGPTADPELAHNGCKKESASDHRVDRLRSQSHTRLCNAASWVDGLFGDDRKFKGDEFRGLLSLGFRHDEFEGFEPKLRVRIKTDLPNVSDRFSAFIGRVEEDSYISNTEIESDGVNNVGLRSSDDKESEWLFGLGYRNPDPNSNGFDTSIGAKLSSGIAPYAKVAYRYLFNPKERHFIHTTQTVFWRKQDKSGVSSKLDYTYIIGEHDIFEWDTNIKYTEAAEQWEWITSTTWHHEFTKTTGISSRFYVRGEEENPVSVPEYGLTFTYVRPFLRDWLSIETGVDFRWEKEYEEDRYENAIRFGIQFEMLLGDYYKRGS